MALRSPARFLVWFALWLLIPYVVFLGGGWAGIYSTDLRSLSVVLIGAALVFWMLVITRTRDWAPRSELLPGFAAALAAFSIGVAFSRMPRLGVEYLSYAVLLTGLYLLFVRLLADADLRPRVMAIVVFVAIAQGAAYLVEVGLAWMHWWDLVGRVTTPPLRPNFSALLLGNPSAVMTVQVLLSTVSVAWVGWKTNPRRAVSALLVLLAVGATVISGSRSGWLALGVAITVTVLAWLGSSRRRSTIRRALRSRAVRLGALGAAIAAALIAIVLAPGFLFRAVSGGESFRLANYAEAWRMFESAVVTGTGPGTWVAQRVAYTTPSEPDYYIPYAHNLPLQTLAEFGLVGALAGAVVVGVLGRMIAGALDDPDAVRRRMGWAAALGTLYFVAHQMLDFYGNSPAALFGFVVPIAYLDATAHRPAILPTRRGLVAVAAGAAACAIAVGGLLLSEKIAATMARAVDMANDGEWRQAVPPARDATADDPDVPAYRFSLATIADHAGEPDVLREYELSAAADSFPAAWLGVAARRADAGDEGGARLALDEALRLGRQQVAVLVAAGDIYLRLGDRERAIARFSDALGTTPSLAADELWSSDERLSEIRDAVFEMTRDRVTGEPAVELALALGRPDTASELVATLPEPTRTVMELVVRGWSGDRTALEALIARAEAEPLNLQNLRWGARVAAHLGDKATADRLRDWSEVVNGLSSLTSFETRFAPPDVEPNEVGGIGSRFYGYYTYRRPTPDDQIAAGLLQLRLE